MGYGVPHGLPVIFKETGILIKQCHDHPWVGIELRREAKYPVPCDIRGSLNRVLHSLKKLDVFQELASECRLSLCEILEAVVLQSHVDQAEGDHVRADLRHQIVLMVQVLQVLQALLREFVVLVVLSSVEDDNREDHGDNRED